MNLKSVVTVVVVIAAATAATRYYRAYRMVPELPAYNSSYTDEKGNSVSLTEIKEPYLLISYFQSWCGDCIRELPDIDALQKYAGKDKLKVMLITDESPEKIRRLREHIPISADIYFSEKPLKDQKINVYPTTYLLDNHGKVLVSHLQRYNWNSEEIRKMIQ